MYNTQQNYQSLSLEIKKEKGFTIKNKVKEFLSADAALQKTLKKKFILKKRLSIIQEDTRNKLSQNSYSKKMEQ